MLKQFLTLLGSIAGINAIFYALGFVVTHIADASLGIGFEFTDRDPAFYVARGGMMVASILIVAIWPALAVILLTSAGQRALTRPGLLRRMPRLPELVERHVAGLAALAMLALAVLALVLLIAPLFDMPPLLFFEGDESRACEGALREALLSQDREYLAGMAAVFALLLGTFIGIAMAARRRIFVPGAGLSVFLASTAGVLFMAMLTVSYGKLSIPAKAPPVWITPAPQGEGAHRLLARSSDGVLIWLEAERKVHWIAARRIDALTVADDQVIAAPPCARQTAKENAYGSEDTAARDDAGDDVSVGLRYGSR